MLVQTTVALGLAVGGAYAASGSAKSTRYWDCCKPSCSWPDKAAVNRPVLACDANNNPLTSPDVKSGCDGGSAYTCANNSPWAVNDNFAFGFAATKLAGGTEASWCCGCYAITFTSGPAAGKKMVVQSTNTGGDLGNNHFDLLMPGGGVGIFDGCSSQFGGIPGQQYGGISSREECEGMPDFLKDGCYWRFDWFNNADNPDLTFEQVQCPQELVDRSGCRRDDDSSFPAFEPPTGGSTSQPHSTTPKPSSSVPPTHTGSSCTHPTSTSSGGSGNCAPMWGQCGGIGFNGPTCCSEGTCTKSNEYYSQCL